MLDHANCLAGIAMPLLAFTACCVDRSGSSAHDHDHHRSHAELAESIETRGIDLGLLANLKCVSSFLTAAAIGYWNRSRDGIRA